VGSFPRARGEGLRWPSTRSIPAHSAENLAPAVARKIRRCTAAIAPILTTGKCVGANGGRCRNRLRRPSRPGNFSLNFYFGFELAQPASLAVIHPKARKGVLHG
jgi:hypothetical protein